MTDEQMEKFAEIIFQKLLTRQAEFDKQFIKQVKESGGSLEVDYNEEVFGLDERGVLQLEIARLSELLSQHEENENYNEAAKVHTKLSKLIDKLDRL
jgi:hypothetical protein